MARQWLGFGWGVPAGGYRWVAAITASDPTSRPRLALVPVESPASEKGAPPPPDPALFRAFAGLPPEEPSILAFAQRYGDLGVDLLLGPATGGAAAGDGLLHGTLLRTWRRHISDMRCLVGLWDLLRQGDRARLAAHIRWEKEEGAKGLVVRFDSHPAGVEGEPSLGHKRVQAVIASQDTQPDVMRLFVPGDPVLPGWCYLRQAIDDHLHHPASEVATAMAWDEGRQRPAMRLVAPTLRSAVWLQLADAVANDLTFSRCRECGRWFEVAPDVARSHRRFCTNACRSKAYRHRQDRARRMFMDQKTFEEIAEELESDVWTVRRWITGSEE